MNGAIQLERKRGVVVVLLYYFANATFYSFIRRTFYGRMTRFPQKKKLSEPFVERAIESVTYVIFRAGLRRSLRFCLGERTVIQKFKFKFNLNEVEKKLRLSQACLCLPKPTVP